MSPTPNSKDKRLSCDFIQKTQYLQNLQCYTFFDNIRWTFRVDFTIWRIFKQHIFPNRYCIFYSKFWERKPRMFLFIFSTFTFFEVFIKRTKKAYLDLKKIWNSNFDNLYKSLEKKGLEWIHPIKSEADCSEYLFKRFKC